LRLLQFCHGPAKFLVAGDSVVPLRHVVHKTNALSFASFRQDQTWFPGRKWHVLERPHQIADVVPVTPANRKAKGFEFFSQGLELHDVFSGTGDLQAIPVDNGDQIIESIMRRGHSGFPVGTLCQFAVAEERKDAIVLAILLGCQCPSHCERQPVSECASVLFDAVYFARGMPNKMRTILVEGLEFLLGKESAIGEHSEESLGTMSFALDIVVAIRILKGLGTYS